MDFSSRSNIVIIPLFRGLVAATNGTPVSPSFLDIDNPRVRALLPHCAGIFLIGLVENVPSTDFEFNVAFFSGFDATHQPASPINIATTPINSGNPQGVRTGEYTQVQNFLPDSRLRASWQNQAGINGIRTGLISAALGCRLST